MTYIVTFEIDTPQPYGEDKVELVTRNFPQFLCGVQMINQMFIEIMLASYPFSSVGIYHIETVHSQSIQ